MTAAEHIGMVRLNHWELYIAPWESNVQALRYTIVTAAGLTPDRLDDYQQTEVCLSDCRYAGHMRIGFVDACGLSAIENRDPTSEFNIMN